MFIENPNRKFKLAHLIEHNKSNLYNFQYEDLYNVVEEWLKSEKQFFFNEEFFRPFVEAFCDRFFRRDFNFDTFLDFKIALRNVFKKYKDNADRIYQSSLLELNPLYTTYMENESTTENTGVSNTYGESDTHGDSTNKNNESSEVEDKHYNLYSDTPQSSLNLDDLLSVNSNYITNITNDLNEHNNKHNSENNNTYKDSNTSKNNTDFKNNEDFKSLQKGYTGNVADLLNNYIELNLDVIKHYLDWIEDECLFSSVMY